MSRQADAKAEQRQAEFRRKLLISLDGGLTAAVERAGGELLGVSLKMDEYEVLMTLRAVFPAGHMVGFIGASDVSTCWVKAMVEARRDNVQWRADKWR